MVLTTAKQHGFFTTKRYEDHSSLTLTALPLVLLHHRIKQISITNYSILLKCYLIAKEHATTKAMKMKAGFAL